MTSVLEQEGVDVELLVMDPGSTDGSRELLARLGQRWGARLVNCFEPDHGQCDAINKGLARARGSVLGWLNSDDRLRPGALRRVVEVLGQGDAPRWLYGRAGMIDADGRQCWPWIARYKNWRGRRFSQAKLLTENFIPQMSAFFNAAMWRRAGSLDVGKDLDMDYDLWLRFARIAEPVVVRETLADFRVHAEAKGSRRTDEQLAAAQRTARHHAAGLGLRGQIALGVHRLLGLRTRVLYRWLKP